MTSPIGKDKSPEFGSTSLSGVFSVEWIKKYYDLLFIFKLSLRGKQGNVQIHKVTFIGIKEE